MQTDNYPWLYLASDDASRAAQKSYFWFLATQLALFSAIGLVGALPQVFPQVATRTILVLTSIMLTLAIVSTFVGRERQFDKQWFDGRAVAESVKTASWRYMMGAVPFDLTLVDAPQKFIAELDEIEHARPGLAPALAGRAPGEKILPDSMDALRAADFPARKATYLENRVRDQYTWYDSKAKWNQRRATYMTWCVLAAQVLALIIAITAAAYGPFRLNLMGLLMTAAASFTAWSQARRYDDLSNSYSLAAQELRIIESLISKAKDDRAFRELVDQGEEAISREHTMWCARRSITALTPHK